MTRSYSLRGLCFAVGAGTVALPLLLAAVMLWPRYAAERHRALGEARAWANASLPAAAVDGAHTELRPTAHGWRVVFRDVDVPCSQTSWGCRTSGSHTDERLVYRDAFVCVGYGSGRGYMIIGSLLPVGGVTPVTCRRVVPADSPQPAAR